MSDLSAILTLGDPRLYEVCDPVEVNEVEQLAPKIELMANLILQFRQTYGAGRAIAAPQIGLMKRMVVMNIDKVVVFFNPVLFDFSSEMVEMWDDCMSFPNLLVKLNRHKTCRIKFRDLHWQEQIWELDWPLSELLQHECDHLDGVLATMRAIDQHAYKWRNNHTMN